MKLVLRGFSQDVDLFNPQQAQNFLVFQDEETGQTARLSVPLKTISELSMLAQGEVPEGVEVTESIHDVEEPELPPEQEEEMPPEGEFVPPPVSRPRVQIPAPPIGKKRMTPTSEDKVPPL